MRKTLLLALLLFPLFGTAQEGPIPGALIDVVPSAPSGSCFQDLPDQQVTITGALYSCQSGTWAQIAGGGGGGAQIAGALSGTLSVPQLVSEYVPTLTTNQKNGTADSYATLQAAITAAIAAGSDLYIPCGTYVASAELVFSSSNFHIRGCGSGNNGLSPVQLTLISASGTGYNTLTVGNGGVWSNPNGWVKDMILNGPGTSNAGYASLVVNGGPQTWIENVGVGNDDIGLDFIGNDYGATILNVSCGTDNVGINFRNGAASGSDIKVWNPWCHGIVAGIQAAGTGGGYSVYGGQVSGGYPTGSPNDNTAGVICGKEYPSGNLGEGSIDFFGTSFEGTNNAWEVRAYAACRMGFYDTSMNATSSSAPAIGVYKNTNQQFGQITFDSNALSGYFSNAQLIVASGETLPGAFISERGTYSAGANPVINGVSTDVINMAAQSGLAYSVGTDRFGLFSQGMWFGNDSGTPAYSTNGSSWTNFFVSPLTNLGDTMYQGPSGPTRLAGNTALTDGVYVSHGANTTVPTTKTCSAFVNGAGNTVTCTLSTAAAIGEFVVVGLIDYQGGSTHAVTDSHSDTFTAIGSIHNASTIGANTQLYYFGPLSASITTITATSSTGSYLAIEANTATNVVSSSPQDGSECFADTTSVTAIPCGTTITTTQANDYVFCDAHNATVGDSFTAGSGFTLGSSFNSNSTAQYQVQAAVGATTPSITSSSASPATMACAAFKSNTSGGGAATAPVIKNNPQLALPLYTVSSGTGNPALPSASSVPTGTYVGVTDATSFTIGTCTGGGTDFVIAVSNGSAWVCQ